MVDEPGERASPSPFSVDMVVTRTGSLSYSVCGGLD